MTTKSSELSARKTAILSALVKHHIRTGGPVEKRGLELGELADEQLDHLSRVVMDVTRGKALGDASSDVRERAKRQKGDASALERVAQALDQVERTPPTDHVVLGGVANIAAEEAFHRRETFRQVYEALERESAILRMLREAALAPPGSVTI